MPNGFFVMCNSQIGVREVAIRSRNSAIHRHVSSFLMQALSFVCHNAIIDQILEIFDRIRAKTTCSGIPPGLRPDALI
jgi:hypothetical protein